MALAPVITWRTEGPAESETPGSELRGADRSRSTSASVMCGGRSTETFLQPLLFSGHVQPFGVWCCLRFTSLP